MKLIVFTLLLAGAAFGQQNIKPSFIYYTVGGDRKPNAASIAPWGLCESGWTEAGAGYGAVRCTGKVWNSTDVTAL
jgi:hypothetical protein